MNYHVVCRHCRSRYILVSVWCSGPGQPDGRLISGLSRLVKVDLHTVYIYYIIEWLRIWDVLTPCETSQSSTWICRCPICQVYIFMRPGAAKLDAACLQTCRLWMAPGNWTWNFQPSSHHFQVWAIRPVLTRLDIRTGASLWPLITLDDWRRVPWKLCFSTNRNGDVDQCRSDMIDWPHVASTFPWVTCIYHRPRYAERGWTMGNNDSKRIPCTSISTTYVGLPFLPEAHRAGWSSKCCQGLGSNALAVPASALRLSWQCWLLLQHIPRMCFFSVLRLGKMEGRTEAMFQNCGVQYFSSGWITFHACDITRHDTMFMP